MWKDKYKVGVEKVDNQHQELFSRVTDFVSTVRKDGDWEDKLEKVKSTMSFMQEYVVVHFDDEERYMKEINFPEYKEHVKIHEEFKNEVNQFAEKFEKEGFKEDLVQSFAGKLMAWLINHVASHDQKIADYANIKGGKK
ncbi:bacteriohemerythrin [Proteinivorax tanatarense]